MATLQSQLITVENQSQNLSPTDLFKLVWGVNYQVLFQYGRSPWVTGGQAAHGHLVSCCPAGAAPPAGAWNLILMDHSDQQGALGYHEDSTGAAVPYAEVFVADAVADGSTASAVASHEALEMLVDPDVANVRTATRSDTQQLYIVEVCDAVQGNDYDVGAPEGRQTGVMVADFCLPAWWELGGSSTRAVQLQGERRRSVAVGFAGIHLDRAAVGSGELVAGLWATDGAASRRGRHACRGFTAPSRPSTESPRITTASRQRHHLITGSDPELADIAHIPVSITVH